MPKSQNGKKPKVLTENLRKEVSVQKHLKGLTEKEWKKIIHYLRKSPQRKTHRQISNHPLHLAQAKPSSPGSLLRACCLRLSDIPS